MWVSTAKYLSHLALIDQRQCAGSEPAVQARLESLASQWETLVAKSAEKSEKLKEASRQQTYNAGVKDIEFWLGEVWQLFLKSLPWIFKSLKEKIHGTWVLFVRRNE